jgi:hypothetical protein
MTGNVSGFTPVKRRNSSALYFLILSYLILQRYFDYFSFARSLMINKSGLTISIFGSLASLCGFAKHSDDGQTNNSQFTRKLPCDSDLRLSAFSFSIFNLP